MESKRINLLIPLIGSSALILSYALIKPDSFEWITLFVPFTIGSKMLHEKSDHGSFISLVFSSIAALLVFVSFKTFLSLSILALMSLRANHYYQPDSISPRLLQKRNMSPFIFVSFAIVKLLLHILEVEFAYYHEIAAYPIVENLFLVSITIALFLIILRESQKKYETLRTRVATSEKNWTNNVMTLLSHNIRTPIASMGNRVDIIKLKSSNGIQISKEDIDALALDRDRVNTIVHGLLSKSSRSIIAAEKSQEVSIYQTLHDYRDRVKILIPEGIDFNLGANDTIALDLALESIISNSEKYGASLVQVSLQANDKEISIQISDDGEGMDAETLKQYGTPFNSTKSKEGGTGLGVYFALQLIKEAGWRWSVESELRKGTSVTINIPKGRLVL